jgi:hypothetical protein
LVAHLSAFALEATPYDAAPQDWATAARPARIVLGGRRRNQLIHGFFFLSST